MNELHLLADEKNIQLYQFKDEKEPLRRFLFSTEETRAIVNNPLVYGFEYTEKLRTGIEHFLRKYQEFLSKPLHSSKVNIVHFLRGGLNFCLREAFAHAYSWNDHGCSFLSSQRSVDENGRWYVHEDDYAKITIPKKSTIVIGDVVATGVTLDHGLQKLTQIIKSQGGSIQRVLFFTIGCHKAEKILEKYAEKWRQIFSDFEGIDLVYIEGKFHLADTKTKAAIKILGTDLLRKECVMAQAFIDSQSEKDTYPLERCTIYDAGSRAFDIPEYKDDVVEYWEEVLSLAEQGVSAAELLEERFPLATEQMKADYKKIDLADLCKRHLENLKNS